MENNEAVANGGGDMQPVEQAEPADNESYWDLGFDTEKYILPGDFTDDLVGHQAVRRQLPARDGDQAVFVDLHGVLTGDLRGSEPVLFGADEGPETSPGPEDILGAQSAVGEVVVRDL